MGKQLKDCQYTSCTVRSWATCITDFLCRLPEMQEKVELLCTVRGILKKIKQSVLVGDRVRVAGIDWDDLRGDLPETCHV